MGAPAAGEVVVVPFPFSDLTQSKVRPALCLADAGRGDRVLCQITSQPYGDPLALKLDDQDFATGGLHAESFVRPGKLFTADANLITPIPSERTHEDSIQRLAGAHAATARTEHCPT